MTLKHLRELLSRIPLDLEHFEIEVWLPGSRIALSGEPVLHQGKGWLIEGNLKPGSALCVDSDERDSMGNRLDGQADPDA